MSQPQFSQFAWGTAARLRLSGAALENATAFGGLSQSGVFRLARLARFGGSSEPSCVIMEGPSLAVCD